MVARKSNVHSALGSMAAGAILLCSVPLISPAATNAQMISFDTHTRVANRDGRLGESDIKSLVKTLGLDADQEALVQALYKGHRAAWESAAKEQREAIKSLFQGDQSSGNQRDFGKIMHDVQKQWQAKRDQLESDFLESVKGIATEDQLANWPRFERDRRRHSLQAKESILGGEGVDLIDISESIDLANEALASLQPVSNLYTEELDQAIADRSRALESVEKASTPPEGGGFDSLDMDAVEKAEGKLLEKHVAVRSINERYAALFSGQLSADEAKEFMDLFKERSFPSIYRPTAADRYIKQVRDLALLNDEQMKALDSIDLDYQHQVDPINDQLVQILRQEEEKPSPPGMFFGGAAPADADFGGDFGGAFTIDSRGSGDDGEDGNGDDHVAIGLVITSVQEVPNNATPEAAQPRNTNQPRLIQRVPPPPPPVEIAVPGVDSQADSPRSKLNKSKSDLVDRTIDTVAALLTPEQLALAPKPDELQRLTPEERVRRRVQEALKNAVITTTNTDDGNQAITFTVDPATGGK